MMASLPNSTVQQFTQSRQERFQTSQTAYVGGTTVYPRMPVQELNPSHPRQFAAVRKAILPNIQPRDGGTAQYLPRLAPKPSVTTYSYSPTSVMVSTSNQHSMQPQFTIHPTQHAYPGYFQQRQRGCVVYESAAALRSPQVRQQQSSQQQKSIANDQQTASGTSNLETSKQTHNQSLISQERLDALLREVDPNATLDDETRRALMRYADDYINDILERSLRLAVHRDSNVLEVKDVACSLKTRYSLVIPGFCDDTGKSTKKALLDEAHEQRIASAKKAVKRW
ncbi:Transcription initiation factor TFIID subunit 12 [Trichinella nativa]|uniref:Transcription initiation factor TFIID subunit 12 n=5 Tax=Trichinella TaxID=6333 RepID=A0A0V1LFL5_9BILA|nr:Transcription initiation factor TFIID subunit 12 [Trichinella murrelli]KRX75920.1 Transcription initiation factor TFIID subunit 12 [Trichinella sp. T6]KRY36272.1 Transcription initiation factor TFIID subunit 12 [Trichinella spiralis]KRY51409.1 Transcription initiation factor TFIID subunit 12 [Trichinella britovi]KRZ58319.1 Transcription initiation factor TFIID subunit 12 [Trichinella nativa]